MTIHEQVDLGRWLNEFPLEQMIEEKKSLGKKHGYEVRDDWLPGGSIICGPKDLAEVEHTRRAIISRGHDLGRTIPIDIFLWRICHISDGPITRIGGRPFRDPSRPWPTAKRTGLVGKIERERPLPFLAQISFLDSKDLVPNDLPGDVLCIYGDWYGKHDLASQSLALEWVDAGNGQDARIVDLPEVPVWPFCAEGVIHRTVSYLDCYNMLLDLGVSMPYTLNSFQATSIGQDAHFVQGEPSDLATLVATLSSFQGIGKWPFVNCPDVPRFTHPMGHQVELDLFSMMLGDMGCLYFYKDKHGRYAMHEDCY
ncbi:MAG: hypothetical protein WD114_00110 [Phycisphaerales bacterium]